MVNLVKGQNVVLTKGVQTVKIGLSWDANNGGQTVDLDAMALELTDKNGPCVDEKHFIFYGNKKDPEGAVVHSGDNLTGDGDGDDEVISVDFSKLDPRVNAILFFVNIYQAKSKGQNFGQVKNPKARLYYSDATVADLVYELDEDFSDKTLVEFVMLYKHNDEWKFKAIGEGNTLETSEEIAKFNIK